MCYGSTKRVKRKGYQIIIHEKSGNFYEIFRGGRGGGGGGGGGCELTVPFHSRKRTQKLCV